MKILMEMLSIPFWCERLWWVSWSRCVLPYWEQVLF